MSQLNTLISVRTEKNLKKKVEKILKELGLTHSAAINMYYHLIVINNGIPFDVKIPNETTKKAIQDSRERKNQKRFNNVNELFEDLNI